jgi:hypothetical protein
MHSQQLTSLFRLGYLELLTILATQPCELSVEQEAYLGRRFQLSEYFKTVTFKFNIRMDDHQVLMLTCVQLLESALPEEMEIIFKLLSSLLQKPALTDLCSSFIQGLIAISFFILR